MLPILLHMHQPDYRNPVTGEPVLPWVRKHALRGYRDVPWILSRTGGRATINLVPSLLDQVDHYADGGADPLLRLLRVPFADLAPPERNMLADHALYGSPRRFDWFPAFEGLRQIETSQLAPSESLDRIVWGELSWFGFSALADFPELGRMRRQGRGFHQADLDRIVEIEREILRDLHGQYREFVAAGGEVSCSPYYHPILPLLVNTAHAQRNLPGNPDPGFAWPDDAFEQLRSGRARVEAWTGARISGVWPSEGSISPEVVKMFAELGFTWAASDEDVLRRSDPRATPSRPAWFEGVSLVFRDHGLSDRIGFVYQHQDGRAAAADLLTAAGRRSAFLALDGENPWEHYPDAGEAFLTALFTSGHTRTVSDFVAAAPSQPLARLHTGSWINADFQIWIGHPEDRLAWSLLVAARQAWERLGRPVEARRHLYAAEGSDWFWWYGDEFSTPVAHVFDLLFRAHLTAAWRAMGLDPEPRLSLPIKAVEPDDVHVGLLGGADDWLGWQAATVLIVRAGAMARVGTPRRLWIGRRGDQWVVRARHADGWQVEGRERCTLVDGVAHVGIAAGLSLYAPDGERVGTWLIPERGA